MSKKTENKPKPQSKPKPKPQSKPKQKGGDGSINFISKALQSWSPLSK